jgi:hypothetical protein
MTRAGIPNGPRLDWSRRLPRVEVRRSAVPKLVTIVMPFYENQNFLGTQVDHWRGLASDLKPWLSAIVVDDGSPAPAVLPSALPFHVRLFRIEVDVRWNWLAARNIGAFNAKDGWLLMTDMDHVVPAETLRALVFGQHDPSVAYAFGRREHTGEPVHPHSASFFLTRELFWRVGGYDERLSGYYGTDGIYRRRLMEKATVQVLRDELVRHENVGDSSTVRYGRKESQDATAKRLHERFLRTKPKTLSFPYHEVRA